jgi:hypothetical protein
MRSLESRDDVVVRITIVRGDLNNPHGVFFDRKRQSELMSIPTKEQAGRFLAPLRGSLTILLLHDIQAKMQLSRFILTCARLQSTDTTILDADAFYCTNIDRFADDAQSLTNARMLLLPEQDFDVSVLLPLLSSKWGLLVIDDLNSLYSLATDGRKLHQLSILMKLISWNAKMNKSWVIATAYRTEFGAKQRPNQRSLTALGDQLVDTDFREGSLRLRSGFKDWWPNGELEI